MHGHELHVAISDGEATESIHQLNIFDLQINGASHFSNDLGLDSLDTVEVVMAIEEVCALFPRETSYEYQVMDV
jgi:hypothetical protein